MIAVPGGVPGSVRDWLLGFAFKFVDGAQVRRLLRVAAEIERRWLRNMPYLHIWPDAEEDVADLEKLMRVCEATLIKYLPHGDLYQLVSTFSRVFTGVEWLITGLLMDQMMQTGILLLGPCDGGLKQACTTYSGQL